MQPALQGLQVQLAPKALPVHKGQKETRVFLECLESQATLAQQVRLALKAQPVRKALQDLPARPEGLAADKSFRAAALSWYQLESAG